MLETDHPLLTKRMGGAIAVLALGSGLGLALMSFGLFPAGMIVACLGAAGAVWIYISDLKQLRLRMATGENISVPLHGEIWVVLLAILIAAGVPAYIYIRTLIPELPKDFSRRLEANQKSRMKPVLELPVNVTYSMDFNSVLNCENCEDYAQELRDFFHTIPGWKTGGGVINFPDPTAPREGLQLVLDKNAPADIGKKLRAAFAAANIQLLDRPDEDIANIGLQAIIVVARPK